MSTYDELHATERGIRDTLARGAEAELRSIPGVVHVSVGLRERGGTVIHEHVIRVYVRQKRPIDEVSPAERIPGEIDGVPVDVNVVGDFDFNIDNTGYRPVVGGIQISNRIIDMNEEGTDVAISRGTMGCIATLTADKSAVLLSNWHILLAQQARIGDPVFQPAPTSVPATSLLELPKRPGDDTDAIGKITKYAISAKVDGAVAKLDVSTCCRCCGVDFHNEIHGLSVGGHPPSNKLVGQRAAVSGMAVYKVGMMTGRTVGHVVDPHFPSFSISRKGTAYTFTGQIAIANDDATTPFSRSGDSGSVIVDGDGYVVGLLFASNTAPPPAHRTMANHIADVCNELGITINFGSAGATAGPRVGVPAVSVGPSGVDAYRPARDRLLRDPAGARLMGLIEEYRAEMVELVNHNRRVTVAWHRVHGPAFLATVLNTVRAADDTLPATVQGVSLEAALRRMGAELSKHGSPALRMAIDEYGPVLLGALPGSETLGAYLQRLNTTSFANRPVTTNASRAAVAAGGR